MRQATIGRVLSEHYAFFIAVPTEHQVSREWLEQHKLQPAADGGGGYHFFSA